MEAAFYCHCRSCKEANVGERHHLCIDICLIKIFVASLLRNERPKHKSCKYKGLLNITELTVISWSEVINEETTLS